MQRIALDHDRLLSAIQQLVSMGDMRVSMQNYERYSPASQEGPYRVRDYMQLTDGEERCELLLGTFYMSPAPTVAHQLVVAAITQQLSELAKQSGGFAISSPVDVVLSDRTVVQPDVVYVSHERMAVVTRQRIDGAPDLIVEVLSPGTSRRDRIGKLALYRAASVPEYWLVDPEAQTFEFLDLRDEQPVVRLAQDDIYHSAHLTDLRLDLATFWSEIDETLARIPRDPSQ